MPMENFPKLKPVLSDVPRSRVSKPVDPGFGNIVDRPAVSDKRPSTPISTPISSSNPVPGSYPVISPRFGNIVSRPGIFRGVPPLVPSFGRVVDRRGIVRSRFSKRR